MKVLVLAAGYGTRLEADITADTTGKYSHLKGLPKPLIPVDNKALLTHWYELLLSTGQITATDIYLVTNQHFYSQFQLWAQNHSVPISNIINDQSTNNSNRLGAIKDITLAINSTTALQTDDLMIIGGDTLFYSDLSLPTVLTVFNQLKPTVAEGLVFCYTTVDTSKTAILVVNNSNIITNCVEKPKPTDIESRLACPCFYLYKSSIIPLFTEYCNYYSKSGLSVVDAPGQFLSWIYRLKPILAYNISGRFDIGGLDSYIECEEAYQKEKLDKKK